MNKKEKVFSLPCGIKTEVNEEKEGFSLPLGIKTEEEGFSWHQNGGE